jgi:hypothetical protein
MQREDSRDARLGRRETRGRSFLLGNKRAFSLSLPIAGTSSPVSQHPHKWFGAVEYARKFFESQIVRVDGEPLSARNLTGFVQTPVHAVREYEVGGKPVSERFFVADGLTGFSAEIIGDGDIYVEPQFDMRLLLAPPHVGQRYHAEALEGGVLVTAEIPGGRFDDRTETFVPDPSVPSTYLFAAALGVGEHVSVDVSTAPPVRPRRYPRDLRRRRQVSRSPDASDHAPLWTLGTSRVFTPARFQLTGGGAVVYGFGSDRESALQVAHALRDNAPCLRRQKAAVMAEILDHAPLETGVPSIDQAYMLVTERLMDALVVRDVPGAGTDQGGPATMILAGNQYFHDAWKRDENIALGFLLAQGRYDLARDVIADTWQLQDPRTGRLPQRIRVGEPPQYHSSDGTLWALKRLHDYWRNTGDDALLREKLPMVELFFQRSLERVVNGLLPSGRTDDPEYLWETWMDTPYTPRHGFPVEIQMLWISALRHFRPVVVETNPDLESGMAAAEDQAWRALVGYISRGIPADSLDEDGVRRDLITPNPYFSFGLGLDLGPEVERAMLRMGRQELAGKQGIVTLAPSDWPTVFSHEFLADRSLVRGRRMRSAGKINYHRGLEWNWLTRFFVEAELKYGEAEAAYRTYLRKQVRAVLESGGVGGISELFDLSGARGPEFQTWSMAGFLEALHSFAGVRIDVPDRRISIAPQVPRLWPRLAARKWYGDIPFDLSLTRRDEGLHLAIDFSGEIPADVTLDVALVVPRGGRVRRKGLMLNGSQMGSLAQVEPLPGTDRVRVRTDVPVRDHLEFLLPLRALPSRSRVPATA